MHGIKGSSSLPTPQLSYLPLSSFTFSTLRCLRWRSWLVHGIQVSSSSPPTKSSLFIVILVLTLRCLRWCRTTSWQTSRPQRTWSSRCGFTQTFIFLLENSGGLLSNDRPKNQKGRESSGLIMLSCVLVYIYSGTTSTLRNHWRLAGHIREHIEACMSATKAKSLSGTLYAAT